MSQCTNQQVKSLFYPQEVEWADFHYSGLTSLPCHDPKSKCFPRISNGDIQKPEYGRGNDSFVCTGSEVFSPGMKTYQKNAHLTTHRSLSATPMMLWVGKTSKSRAQVTMCSHESHF